MDIEFITVVNTLSKEDTDKISEALTKQKVFIMISDDIADYFKEEQQTLEIYRMDYKFIAITVIKTDDKLKTLLFDKTAELVIDNLPMSVFNANYIRVLLKSQSVAADFDGDVVVSKPVLIHSDCKPEKKKGLVEKVKNIFCN